MMRYFLLAVMVAIGLLGCQGQGTPPQAQVASPEQVAPPSGGSTTSPSTPEESPASDQPSGGSTTPPSPPEENPAADQPSGGNTTTLSCAPGSFCCGPLFCQHVAE